MASRRSNGTNHIDARLGALRSDLDALQEDVKGLANGAGDVAADTARRAIRNAESVAERSLRLAEETASHFADDVGHWANGNVNTVRETIRSQPLLALLLSLGVGALLATILHRD